MLGYNSNLLVKMTIKPPADEDIHSVRFKYNFAEKIAQLYMTGKQVVVRKRRATESDQAQVILLIIEYILGAILILIKLYFLESSHHHSLCFLTKMHFLVCL